MYLIKFFSGVLLLNACLTVQAHNANSHKDKGWEEFTTSVIKAVAAKNEKVVFLLWGSYAQKKAAFLDKVCVSFIKKFLFHMQSGHNTFFLQKHPKALENYQK